MVQFVEAIYEDEVFKPLSDIDLPDRQRVRIVVLPEGVGEDDVPAWAIAALAEHSRSFDFLADSREDNYSVDDGEPLS